MADGLAKKAISPSDGPPTKIPDACYKRVLARLTRFERATPAFGGQYSIQLSYRRKEEAKHSVFRRSRPSGQANTPPYSPREFGDRGGQTLPLGFTTRKPKT